MLCSLSISFSLARVWVPNTADTDWFCEFNLSYYVRYRAALKPF